MLTMKPEVSKEIEKELNSIPEKYQNPFNSTHEGLAVIWEEFEELKDEVFFGEKRANRDTSNDVFDMGRAKTIHKERLRKEAIQTSAMCIRFIQELT